MSTKKTVSVLSFIKKNFYYFLIGLSLIIIVTVTAVVLATGSKTPNEGKLPESIKESTESITKPESEYKEPESQPGSSGGNTGDIGNNPIDKPVDTKIVFALPVSYSSIIKNYTSSTVVFNQTLGVYTGHMGIDFGAEAGAQVVAVYDGTIESITTSYLQGTTITVNHGNGLKTVYNSIDAIESLSEGDSVVKGEVIGSVSDNNRQEYKDGPHLHFEVLKDEVKIDPNEYLMLAEK